MGGSCGFGWVGWGGVRSLVWLCGSEPNLRQRHLTPAPIDRSAWHPVCNSHTLSHTPPVCRLQWSAAAGICLAVDLRQASFFHGRRMGRRFPQSSCGSLGLTFAVHWAVPDPDLYTVCAVLHSCLSSGLCLVTVGNFPADLGAGGPWAPPKK